MGLISKTLGTALFGASVLLSALTIYDFASRNPNVIRQIIPLKSVDGWIDKAYNEFGIPEAERNPKEIKKYMVAGVSGLLVTSSVFFAGYLKGKKKP